MGEEENVRLRQRQLPANHARILGSERTDVYLYHEEASKRGDG